jgi:hypothetical protein
VYRVISDRRVLMLTQTTSRTLDFNNWYQIKCSFNKDFFQYNVLCLTLFQYNKNILLLFIVLILFYFLLFIFKTLLIYTKFKQTKNIHLVKFKGTKREFILYDKNVSSPQKVAIYVLQSREMFEFRITRMYGKIWKKNVCEEHLLIDCRWNCAVWLD